MAKHIRGTYKITAQRLKIALDNKGLKAQELADRANINKASISHYINGSHQPSNKTATQMALVLGVNPLWLMGFDVEPNAPVGSNVDTVMKSLSKTDIIKNAFNDSGVFDEKFTDDEIIDIIKYAEFILNKRG